jgi:oxygen-independent coproporphyrinogen-3 oxidase
MTASRPSLADLLARGGYLSYAYAYPHKTAYRTLSPPADLRDVWSKEDKSALFLYLHVPFCEQRCGFCNLFTQVTPKADVPARYLDALAAQAAITRDVLGEGATFARMAIGGGTPTYLTAPQLDRLFGVAASLGASGLPTSIEASPATLDEDKVAVLGVHRVTRVSLGVQSVFAEETAGVQRRQVQTDVARALRSLVDVVPTRNVDLIYGLPGQTDASLRASIDAILELGANELYLYPLYVRPLTILGRHGAPKDDRLALYRAGRAHLLALGWRQISMRMFSAPSTANAADQRLSDDGPMYRCQDDGMIGLGPGARSYTRRLHYASPFAVGQHAIRDRVAEWIALPAEEHALARHGFWLDEAEERRRYVLLSLLDRGVDRAAYRARFGDDALVHVPELAQVVDTGLGTLTTHALVLTEQGVERADVLGDFLQSTQVVDARAAWAAV